MAQSVAGLSNNFPAGQCTQYADERYHTLTGYYVPFSGNAQDWSHNALMYGWKVSSNPVVPSIICLQGGVQGSDVAYGHVAVVEGLSGKNVVTSNLNWGSTPSQVSTVLFSPGIGVSFIYAVDNSGRALGSSDNGIISTLKGIVSGDKTPVHIAPDANVTTFLWSLDQTLALTNPFANVQAGTGNIAGITFTDPVAWLEQVGGNVIDDLSAGLIRLFFLIIGVLVILKVIDSFVDLGAVFQTASGGIRAAQLGAAFL